jgi:hypothetical protein
MLAMVVLAITLPWYKTKDNSIIIAVCYAVPIIITQIFTVFYIHFQRRNSGNSAVSRQDSGKDSFRLSQKYDFCCGRFSYGYICIYVYLLFPISPISKETFCQKYGFL